MSDVETIPIAVVDGSHDFRRRFQSLLEGTSHYACTIACARAREAMHRLRDQPVTLLLFDPQTERRRAAQRIREFKAHFSRLRILVLADQSDTRQIISLLAAGADGFWLKSCPLESTLGALNELANGGSPLALPVRQQLVRFFQHQGRQIKTLEGLSRREKQILGALASGSSYKTMAGQFTLSLDTVRTYIRRLYAKLHVHSRGEATALWLSPRM